MSYISMELDLEKKREFGIMMREVMQKKGWLSQKDFAVFSGMSESVVSKLTRGFTDGITFTNVVKFCLALDIDVYDIIRMFDLDKQAIEAIKDPKSTHLYVNLCWLADDTHPTAGPLEQLLDEVPEEKRDLARDLIQSTLTQLKK